MKKQRENGAKAEATEYSMHGVMGAILSKEAGNRNR